MRRSFNADFINAVINHESVREGAEAKGVADVSGIIADKDNYLLVNDHGGVIFIKDGDNLEMHTQFLPEGRGAKALTAVTESILFVLPYCKTVITKVNKAQKGIQRMTGILFNRVSEDDKYIHYSLKDEVRLCL